MKVYVVTYMMHSHSENQFQVHESELNAHLHFRSLVDKEKERIRQYKDTIRFYEKPEEYDDLYRSNCDDDIRISIRLVDTDEDFNPENPLWSMEHCW